MNLWEKAGARPRPVMRLRYVMEEMGESEVCALEERRGALSPCAERRGFLMRGVVQYDLVLVAIGLAVVLGVRVTVGVWG
jgi:phosphopantothenate synthetase